MSQQSTGGTHDGCTVWFALGRPAGGKSLVGKTLDWSRHILLRGTNEIVTLVTPKKGHRYVGLRQFPYQPPDDPSVNPGINEKGVSSWNAAKHGYGTPPKQMWKTLYYRTGEVLKKANTAEEAVKIAANIVEENGIGPFGGGSLTYVDAKEAWYIETPNPEKGFEIIGPIRETIWAHGNRVLSQRLVPYERAPRASGFWRASRALELLNKRAYRTMKGESLTIPYFFQIARDHRWPPDRTIHYEQQICSHGYHTNSISSGVAIPNCESPHLLSTIWLALGQPCSTPFVPFYIGITSVPDSFNTPKAIEKFHNLAKLIDYCPEHRERITHYWCMFEIHTLQEAEELEEKVITLDQREEEKARQLLTEFTTSKCQEALNKADQLLGEIKEGHFFN